MPRARINVDLKTMQSILDSESIGYTGGLIAFLDKCAALYNERMNPVKPLYGQLIYMRIKHKELHCNVEATKKKSSKPTISFAAKKNCELSDLVDKINRLHGTRYVLELHGKYAQLGNDENGPCLSLAGMKIYLQGMLKNSVDGREATEYSAAS